MIVWVAVNICRIGLVVAREIEIGVGATCEWGWGCVLNESGSCLVDIVDFFRGLIELVWDLELLISEVFGILGNSDRDIAWRFLKIDLGKIIILLHVKLQLLVENLASKQLKVLLNQVALENQVVVVAFILMICGIFVGFNQRLIIIEIKSCAKLGIESLLREGQSEVEDPGCVRGSGNLVILAVNPA